MERKANVIQTDVKNKIHFLSLHFEEQRASERVTPTLFCAFHQVLLHSVSIKDQRWFSNTVGHFLSRCAQSPSKHALLFFGSPIASHRVNMKK
jgi:hypothetical protein